MIGNFIALDFETSYGHIPCSIGIVEFIDGIPINEYYSLIKPIDLKFNPINSRINGIYIEDVLLEREFNEVWEDIKHLFQNSNIVAHNASTDISILEKTLEYYNVEIPNYTVFCTLSISRFNFKLDSYKLSFLANYFKVEQKKYHNALDDAYVCGCLFNIFNPNVFEYYSNPKSRVLKNLTTKPKAIQRAKFWNTSKILENKTLVVSGVFEKFSRDELKKAIEDNGGKVGSSISSKTSYVVAGANMGPSKLEKATSLGIPILSEEDFMEMIS